MLVNSVGLSSVDSDASFGPQQLSSDAFLTLLIAQLTHQDPLAPMQSHEFMAQLAQLESVSQLREIRDYLQAASQLSNPMSTLGRIVYWEDSSGQSHSGEVSAVVRDDSGAFKLVVEGEQIDFSQVTRIE